MARTRRYRWWTGFAAPDRAGGTPKRVRPATRRGKRKQQGITNEQARYLANLQRRLGVPYTGNTGISSKQASSLIEELKRQ